MPETAQNSQSGLMSIKDAATLLRRSVYIGRENSPRNSLYRKFNGKLFSSLTDGVGP